MEFKMNENNRSSEMGIFPRICGEATLDQDIGFVAKFIMTTAAGGILVQNPDGQNQWLPSVPANTLFPFLYTKILTSGTDWQGNSRTSVTATFTFFGCE